MFIPEVKNWWFCQCFHRGYGRIFLWYNSYPAQVFMGDTGSLTIGGIIAVFAIIIHKEFLIPILCGLFLVESLSVIMQVSWFKYTKKNMEKVDAFSYGSPTPSFSKKREYLNRKLLQDSGLLALH